MERRDEKAAVAQEYGRTVVAGQDLDARAGLGHAGRTDEDAAQRLVLAGQLEIGVEARDLTPVRVPRDLHVDEAEMVSVEQDHPGARPEDRPSEAPDRLLDPVEPHQSRNRRRLAPGNDQTVETVELVGLSHLDRVRAEAAQDGRVLAEVALNCQDSDSRRRVHVAILVFDAIYVSRFPM